MDSVKLTNNSSQSLPIGVGSITELQDNMVVRWHEVDVANLHDGFLGTVCQQHSFNFNLWHEEDIARCPESDDSVIAGVKRAIDGFNQQRNDWIERIDDEIAELLAGRGVQPLDSARLNTETPGSVIDRLSILSLRIYHLREQLGRHDATSEHKQGVEKKLAVCLMQKDDLSRSLHELLEDIFSGRKRHRTYRQFKMYNDPTLNPYLYQASSN